MRRKKAEIQINSTQETLSGRQFDAKRSYRGLHKRIASLESDVSTLKREFEKFRLRDLMAGNIPTGRRRRRGPKPVPDSQLIEMKTRLVFMLESYWPELGPFCSSNPDCSALKTVLEAIANTIDKSNSSAAKHLIEHFEKLAEFLSGDRFLDDPRQIANAFAGAPDIGVWRSLKRCAPLYCMVSFEGRALKHYIRRKHNRLFQMLRERKHVTEFAAVWPKYRTKDRNLIGFTAQSLFESWQSCTPRFESIGLTVRAGFVEHLK